MADSGAMNTQGFGASIGDMAHDSYSLFRSFKEGE